MSTTAEKQKTLQPGEIAVNEIELKLLIELTATLKNDLFELYKGSIGLLSVLGLAENGQVKAEAFGEDGKTLPHIIKQAGNIIGLVMKSQAPGPFGKNAAKELTEKFAFFTPLIPLFIKYGEEFKNEIQNKQS